MSIYLEIDAEEPEQIASNKGWGDVCRWVETLPANCVNLYHLCEHGYEENVKAVREQIKLGREIADPSMSLASILDNLEALLDKSAKDATIICITNGMS